MGRLTCRTCRGVGLVPASPTKRHWVMDCPACSASPAETLEEQAARLRERCADLEAQLAKQGRVLRETRAEQDAALMREGVL